MGVELGPNVSKAKRDKSHVLPLSGLRIERNGIDRVKTPTNRPGLLYEDHCFDQLLGELPQDYIIGPRLLDFMGDTCHSTLFNSQGRTRPDFLILSNYLSMTFLTGIAEAKSGNKPELQSKAEGFKDLVLAIEADPGAICQGLRLAIGDVVDDLPLFPSHIVPLEDELPVVFITNHEVGAVRGEHPNLKFHYMVSILPQELTSRS